MAQVPIISDSALALDDFPAQLRRHVDPRAPFPLREMAAKGLVPGMAPGDLVKVLYNLQFDKECGATVSITAGEMPAPVRAAVLSAALPPKVLDFCARRWLSDAESVERILGHGDVADETVAFIAGKCDAQMADLVSENQVRFVRFPLIVEQLYTNPSVHQSTIDRVVEFARRQGVQLTGLPGLESALKGGMALEPEPTPDEVLETVVRDDAFASILENSALRGELEDKEGVTMGHVEARMSEFSDLLEQSMSNMATSGADPMSGFGADQGNLDDQEDEARYVSKQVLIGKMKISEKVRLATIGAKEERMLLLKDANRLVYMAALLSPKMQPEDLKSLAGNKNMNSDVIGYIAGKRELLRDYGVVKALANNPKTALRTGIRLLNYLRDADVRMISRSRQVSPQLSRMAKNQLKKKGQA
jgi:hypothetical protein